MNTYNRSVVEQYCREVGYSAAQKRALFDRLIQQYGEQLLAANDVFYIDRKAVTVLGKVDSIAS